MPETPTFPAAAFERLLRADTEGCVAVYQSFGGYVADQRLLARWALAAVPRMIERNGEIANNTADSAARNLARLNLADLGIPPEDER